jgi:hypothetical protein
MCLEKNPANRPLSAGALFQTLESCENSREWSERKASGWWESFGKRRKDATSLEEPTATSSRPVVTATERLEDPDRMCDEKGRNSADSVLGFERERSLSLRSNA